ncbi:MAG: hypothetical protein NTV06_02375 [candidate division Zixibacteria bacterium]|nr:hypothetical protein [candidate division Zixibacteria bacterium]
MITLSNIPGQPTVKRILLNSLNRQKLASTYLFYGKDGLGKWPMAIAMAALVNCEKPVKDADGHIVDACGKCRNCRQIANLIFPELHFAIPIPPHKNTDETITLSLEYLEQKKKEPYRNVTSTRQLTIPVDVAREIRQKTAIKPQAGLKRVILFYQMEKMLPASADSLLKLIEEPPPETIIILTANDPNNLLPTIPSRAQKILFKPIPEKEITEYISAQYGLEIEKAAFWARLSMGSLGQALSLIEGEEEISLRQTSFLMFKSLFLKDIPSAVATINEFINPNNRGETEYILRQWQSFLSDIILLKYGGHISEIINSDLGAEFENLLVRVSDPDSPCNLLMAIKGVTLSLRRNVHIRPAMTALAFQFQKCINQSS